MTQVKALIERIQQQLMERPELAPYEARALLSINRERLIIQYRNPESGHASSFDAGFVADFLAAEDRLVGVLLKRLRGSGPEKVAEAETRTGT